MVSGGFILLRREDFIDNHKRVYRVYCEEGLNLRSKRPRRNRAAANRQPNDSTSSILHECWSMDFVSDQLFDSTKFRGLTIVDNYSRKCLAIQAEKSLKGSDVVDVILPLNKKPFQNALKWIMEVSLLVKY